MNISYKNKIKTLQEIIEIANTARRKGKKIVTTNGCFDLLHPGHIASLEWAKKQGDILIVGINGDKSVRMVLGKDSSRPIVEEQNRALVLAGLSAVDYVFIFKDKMPAPWLVKIKPHIHVKGRDSEKHPAFPTDVRAVKKGGGRVLLAPKIKGHSTTKIINDILRKNKQL